MHNTRHTPLPCRRRPGAASANCWCKPCLLLLSKAAVLLQSQLTCSSQHGQLLLRVAAGLLLVGVMVTVPGCR